MTVIRPIAGIDSSPANADAGLREQEPSTQQSAMLAHDIRGALAGVVGGVMAIEEAAVPKEIADQIARIATASRSLECLIGLLLGDVEETASGEPSTVDLAEFAAYLRRRWASEAVEAGGKLTVDIADDVVGQLSVERMALARLLGNLIRNAILHGQGAEVLVAVHKGPSGDCVLTVSDNGPGLPADILAPSSGSAPEAIGGKRGLGLEIVKTISQEVGATFEINNRIEGGVEASVTFPETRLSAATVGPEKKKQLLGDLETSLSGVRVLLAEDNPTNQMVANQMLRALDAEVTISSDGVEALEAFEKDAYDLVVVDIEMPRMSGLDVIRAIRSRKDERAVVPIVALTAYALREHRDRIAEAGANGLISKPITSIESLGVALSEYISASQDLKASQQPASESVDATEHADPVVDMAVYQSLCDAIGDDMMAELLDKVIGDLEEARSELHAAITPLNLAPVRSVSHILISVAGAIGANRLQYGARDLNKAAHSEDSDVQSRSTALLDDIDAAIEFARGQRSRG